MGTYMCSDVGRVSYRGLQDELQCSITKAFAVLFDPF